MRRTQARDRATAPMTMFDITAIQFSGNAVNIGRNSVKTKKSRFTLANNPQKWQRFSM